MTDALQKVFLDYSAAELRQLAGRIKTCLGKLTEEQVWARGSDNENAIGNLVLHLCGNVRQWIVSGVGGQKDLRDRPSEFAARGGVTLPELAERLHGVVEEAAAVLGSVSAARLAERIEIQKYEVTVLEAIYHVVEHFSGHTGQIMFATKMMTGTDLGFYRHLNAAAAHGNKTP
ncbi:MAG TPA: DinB family protein [Bryobacteraceae bacterium]|nr:DinB family protein [Bryobacteraceae bacterium]